MFELFPISPHLKTTYIRLANPLHVTRWAAPLYMDLIPDTNADHEESHKN